MQKIRLGMLLATAAFFTSGISATAQTHDAKSVVNSFYATYAGSRQGWLHLTPLRQYLTPSLYSLLKKAATIQIQSHEEVLDFDPFANAQEQMQSFTVGNASVNGTTATVPVNIGYGHGPQSGRLRVITVRTSTGWSRVWTRSRFPTPIRALAGPSSCRRSSTPTGMAIWACTSRSRAGPGGGATFCLNPA